MNSLVLPFDQGIVLCTVGVILGKDPKPAVVAVFGDEPSRRLGDSARKGEEANWPGDLEQDWHTPTPLPGNVKSGH
jgi:hypothetical protein